MTLTKCDNCGHQEKYKGEIDCAVWTKEKEIILCDDCFHNENWDHCYLKAKGELMKNVVSLMKNEKKGGE